MSHLTSGSALPANLLELAPSRLPNERTTRYGGDGVSIELAELVPADGAIVVRLYRSISALLELTAAEPAEWGAISTWRSEHELDSLTDAARELGYASQGSPRPPEKLAEAMHDVRGGGLSALFGRMHFLEQLPRDAESQNTLFVLARDHLKIMRNAIVGLDDARREKDTEHKAHGVGPMVAKWHEAMVSPEEGEPAVRVVVRCDDEGTLAECCLENAAVDRVFYNLANNAARHTADAQIEVTVFRAVPNDANLRFVVSNAITPTAAARLRETYGGMESNDDHLSLSTLFEPGVSSTGSGYGLAVVAEFVKNAFGLVDRQTAIRAGYVGAKLCGSTFHAWFHWPLSNR